MSDGVERNDPVAGEGLTETQSRILDALCRPLSEDGPYASPATNKEIAQEVFLSVDAVKGHLRALYAKLGLEELPQNRKRARLAEIRLSGALDEVSAAPAPPGPSGEAPAPRPPDPSPVGAQPRRRFRPPSLSPRRAASAAAAMALLVFAALALAGALPGSHDDPSSAPDPAQATPTGGAQSGATGDRRDGAVAAGRPGPGQSRRRGAARSGGQRSLFTDHFLGGWTDGGFVGFVGAADTFVEAGPPSPVKPPPTRRRGRPRR